MADLRDTRVLVLGLGLLGGGAATVNWLLDHGASVTVADRRDEHELAASVRRVLTHLRRSSRDGAEHDERISRLSWALGNESADLLTDVALLVANPAIPGDHPLIEAANERGIPVTNEANLFYSAWRGLTVGITGSRGKTTTVRWANHLIPRSVAVGNAPESPFLAPTGSRPLRVAVTELPSFLLERFAHAPKVAVVTNVYRDHLDRHGTMEQYAATKARLFASQRPGDTLILNADDQWTAQFTAMRPAATVLVHSHSPLAPGRAGLWHADGALWQLSGGFARRMLAVPTFAHRWGAHNVSNLMAAVLAARTLGVSWTEIGRRVRTLPEIPFRQQVMRKTA